MSAKTIEQLNSARALALGDGRYYPTIMPGVVPIISKQDQPLEVQRWGADFLAEAFGSPTWPLEAKETMAPLSLGGIKQFLDNATDTSVIKSAVQAAASIYPVMYKHT